MTLGEWHHAFDERPTGVTVLAILYLINAAISLVAIAVFAYFSSHDFFEPYPIPGQAFAQPLREGHPSLMSAITIAVSVMFGIIAGINILIGIGLFKGKRWARNLALAFAIINIIIYSVAIPATFGASLAMVFFNGFILWYLYRSHVVLYFRK